MRQEFEAELQTARMEVSKAQEALASSEDRIRNAEQVRTSLEQSGSSLHSDEGFRGGPNAWCRAGAFPLQVGVYLGYFAHAVQKVRICSMKQKVYKCFL